jgi:hypothetical protein
MSHSSTHHSFSVELAIKYKMEKAAIIHHLQHWIKLNRRKKSDKHFIEGRWWTYQTLSDLADYLPYMSSEEIKYHMEQLVEMGVILKGKYNKSKIDKTTWYAFKDESLFLGEEDSNNPYERENSLSTGKIPSPSGKIPSPIPDPKSSDPKTTDIKISKRGRSAPPSADASGLADFFLMKIKEVKHDFKPQAFQNWAYDFEAMLKEGRDLDLAKKIIEHLVKDKANLIYVQSAKKFRKDFDALQIKMEVAQSKVIINQNRQYALNMKAKYPEQLKALKFDDKFVGNRETGKEIPFDLLPQVFIEVFVTLFGGQHVR